MNTTNPIELLGSYWTLAVGADAIHEQRCFHDFRKRVETAANAGFKGAATFHALAPYVTFVKAAMYLLFQQSPARNALQSIRRFGIAQKIVEDLLHDLQFRACIVWR